MLSRRLKEELQSRASDGWRLVALFLVAFAVRIIYLLESRSTSPFFYAPVVDAQSYLELAQHIVAGNWLAGDAPFWQPPGFPYLLAAFVSLFGDGVFTAVRVAHALLGAGSTVLVYLLSQHAFGRPAATLAASCTALYGPLIYFEGELLSVALEVFLNLALLLTLVRATESDRMSAWALSGLVAGAAAITRPNVLLFVVVVGLAHIAQATEHTRRRTFACLTMAVMGLIVVIAPVTIRNAVVGEEFVLISANGGVNFHIGNHARQDSMVAIHPGVDWERLVAEPLAAGSFTAGERSRYFYLRGFDSIVADPVGWLELLGHKVWQLLQGPEIKRNQDVYYARAHSRVLSVLLWDRGLSFPHGLLAPFMLLGLVLTWRRRHPTLRLMRLFLAGYAGSVILFFVTSRYRVPIVPVATMFAAAGLQGLLARTGSGQRARLAQAGALLVGLLLVNLQQAPPVEQDAQLQHDLGEVLLRNKSFAASAAHSRQAVALEPDYPSAWHNLAVALLGLEQPRQAEGAAHSALALHPARADTRIVLARSLLALGQQQSGLAQLQHAAEQEPDNSDVQYAIGRLLLQMERPGDALPHLQKAAQLRPVDYWAHYDLGRVLHRIGRLSEALKAFDHASKISPTRADALSAAGAVALSSGDAELARGYLNSALTADADYLPARINLGLLEVGAGRYQIGIDLLEAVVHRAASPNQIWSALAHAYQATGETQKARAAIEAARAQ
jgi:Flp pilus assembly protein TadD/4-amino-4-deoxy-L-arabinose transferase-like glycosyltransferase